MAMRGMWLGVSAVIALGVAGPVCAGPPAPPPGSPVALHGALSVKGNQVVDAHGKPVALHGMSLFWSQAAPQYYSAEPIDWLAKDWKVSVVRAAIAAVGFVGVCLLFVCVFVLVCSVFVV